VDWDYRITSDFEELKDWEPEGEAVEIGFRPSGELHVGNLLSITYAAMIADWLQKDLRVTVCDTDWSAHIHEHHMPENNRVMKLFFNRSCGCGEHDNIAQHRLDEIEPFLKAVESHAGLNIERSFLTDLQGNEEYVEGLRTILKNLDDFDEIFGGGFRRRYISPVTAVCENCGYSHSKGCSYDSNHDKLVSPCRNRECTEAFISEPLEGEIGVYYLVDPIRDISRNNAVHVFGGDYRTAEKEQVTPKVQKVAKITELAFDETPAYFLAPMISSSDGKPLSKSEGTGTTVSEIDDLEEYGRFLVSQVSEWLSYEKRQLDQENLLM